VIDFLTASAGIALGAVAARLVPHLREHRIEPVGVADLLNWGFVVDAGPRATILQKDGSLLAGWRYRGPDLSAATAEDIDALMAHVNDALLPFTDNWMFHVDATRRPALPYRPGVFPDPVCQLIDDERREAYSDLSGLQFETTYALVATYLPPADAIARAASFFVQDAALPVARLRADNDAWDRVLIRFRSALNSLEDRLGPRLTLEPFDAEPLLTHLHECLTGLSHRVCTPSHGAYLDAVLADQELIGGFEPTIGRQSIRVVGIQGYPERSRAGELDVLNSLGLSYRWSTRLIPLGTREAARVIRRHQLQWFKKRKARPRGHKRWSVESERRPRAQTTPCGWIRMRSPWRRMPPMPRPTTRAVMSDSAMSHRLPSSWTTNPRARTKPPQNSSKP